MSSFPPEYGHLWSVVIANPYDFTSWEQLIRTVESVPGGITSTSPPSDLAELHKVYKAFLKQFPLCFGYWKKFADWELKLFGHLKADKIYREALGSISNSVDLWKGYCEFKIAHFDVDMIRSTFEEGANAIGLDFLSHPFWDVYIDWEETKQQDYGAVVRILERVIKIPLHQYARYFEKYTQLSVTRPVKELVSEDEFSRIKQQILSGPSDQENHDTPTEEQIQALMRQKIHQIKSDIYMKTQELVGKRWMFEMEIKRPYFHVQPLSDVELNNWKAYLEFEESEASVSSSDEDNVDLEKPLKLHSLDDFKRISFLYERCLVPCALYEDMWMRYVLYLLSQNRIDDARNVFTRACTIHLTPNKSLIRLIFASFEEEQGRYEEAKNILTELLKTLPGHAETIIQFAYMIRRKEGLEEAISFLSKKLEESSKLQENMPSEQRQHNATNILLSVLKIKFEYFLTKDVEKTRKAFTTLMTRQYPNSSYVAFSFIAFESELIRNDKAKGLLDAWNIIQSSSISSHDISLMGTKIANLLDDYSSKKEHVNEWKRTVLHLRLALKSSNMTDPLLNTDLMYSHDDANTEFAANVTTGRKRGFPETSVDTSYAAANVSAAKQARTDTTSPYSALATAGTALTPTASTATGYYGYVPVVRLNDVSNAWGN